MSNKFRQQSYTGPRRAKTKPPEQVRKEVMRRGHIFTKKPEDAALDVAAIAVLTATGRTDIDDAEIRRERERIRESLRARFGFKDSEKDAAVEHWNKIKAILSEALPDSAVESWLDPLEPRGYRGGRLYLAGPERSAQWWEARHASAIAEVGETEVSIIRPDDD